MSESFKALFVGDQHFADTPPASRLDDYTMAIFHKMAFIFAYAISKRIPYVILLGDLLHRKRPSLNSHHLISRLMSMFFEFKEEFRKVHGREARVFTLVGNHDFHFTLDNLKLQPIFVLAQSGAIEILSDTPIQLECGVEINGKPYGEDTETSPAAYHLRGTDGLFKIWCFHSTLLPDGESFYGTWVNFHQVADIAADVVVCGHYHPGYPVQQAHGKFWLNPGSISRGTAEDHNLSRQLKVVGFVRRPDGSFDFKDIPIPHKPADEVFNIAEIKEERKKKSDIEAFVEAIQSNVVENGDFDSLDKFKAALTDMSNDPDVVAQALRYIEAAADEQGA